MRRQRTDAEKIAIIAEVDAASHGSKRAVYERHGVRDGLVDYWRKRLAPSTLLLRKRRNVRTDEEKEAILKEIDRTPKGSKKDVLRKYSLSVGTITAWREKLTPHRVPLWSARTFSRRQKIEVLREYAAAEYGERSKVLQRYNLSPKHIQNWATELPTEAPSPVTFRGMVSFRPSPADHDALQVLAAEAGVAVSAYVADVVARHVRARTSNQ